MSVTRAERTTGARARPPAAGRACESCLRRSWLLGELGAVLDCNCRADGRLFDLLELGDAELIQALGGRRRRELAELHAAFCSQQLLGGEGVAAICRHDARYPLALRREGAPPALFLAGGPDSLRELAQRPIVALLGGARASDYGVEVAASLARGLAASGVTVASGVLGAIAPAAQAGALAVGGATLAVVAGGLDRGVPARRRALLRRVARAGCLVSELPCGVPRRRWTAPAAERIVASLAAVALVVEAEDDAFELAGARVAQALGRSIAAVPGRVTSRASRGPHALLRDGAAIVRDVEDVLELLLDADQPLAAGREHAHGHLGLEPRLRELLERVGAGADTVGRLLASGAEHGALLQALGELELLGLLARGDGGRYVVREPLAR